MEKCKAIKVHIDGKEVELYGYSTDKWRYYCDYSVLCWGKFNTPHEIKRVVHLCKVKTSSRPMLVVVCAKCYQAIKHKQWFIKEVGREQTTIQKEPKAP